MNWKKKIAAILGKFWYLVFKATDFIFGVEYLESLYAKLVERGHQNWLAGQIAKNLGIQQDAMPFVLYLETEATPAISLTAGTISVTSGTIAVSSGTTEWTLTVLNSIPCPHTLQNHIIKPTHTWFEDLDFRYNDNKLSVYADPATLDWPIVHITDADGQLRICYRLFGFRQKLVRQCDMVSGFISPELVQASDVAWYMHQMGATFYAVKKLLAAVTGCVVADNDGIVEAVWDEQNLHCVQIGGKVYHSTKPANVQQSDVVKKGAILFGDMVFYRGSDTPSAAEIPGMRVRTDVGEMQASNTELDIEVADELPLTSTNADIVAAYKQKCADLRDDPNSLKIHLSGGTSINPYLYIMSELKNGRDCIVSLSASALNQLAAAFDCIRKSICLGGTLHVYVKAETDTTTVASSFAADAGMSAVAVDATTTIIAESAEAGVIL